MLTALDNLNLIAESWSFISYRRQVFQLWLDCLSRRIIRRKWKILPRLGGR
jgi:hypothetical protein